MTTSLKTKTIDVVILCGGFGKRLQSLFPELPKALVDINGRPFLAYLIEHVKQFGFKRFILCTGYKGALVKEYFTKRSMGVEIVFSEESEPLGTAGALKHAEGLLRSSPLLVLNGDSLCTIDLNSFFYFHNQQDGVASLALTANVDTIEDCGTVTLDTSGKIMSFEEKKKSRDAKPLANAGVYFLKKEICAEIPAHTQCSLEYDLFPQIIGQGVYGFKTTERLIDIGTPPRYRKACELLK